MPRFTLKTLFLLVTVSAVIAASWHFAPALLVFLVAFWPAVGSLGWIASTTIGVRPRHPSDSAEYLEQQQRQRARAEWRKGILIVGVILQIVWLPLGIPAAFGIAIWLSGGI